MFLGRKRLSSPHPRLGATICHSDRPDSCRSWHLLRRLYPIELPLERSASRSHTSFAGPGLSATKKMMTAAEYFTTPEVAK